MAEPEALGKALGQFLGEAGFTARAAVAGLPARWLLVKPKEVPPADPATLADLLRLQAEGEFSSELRDLVYEYAGDPAAAATGDSRSVLMMATGRKHVDAAVQMCEAAGLRLLAVTPSAVALGAATVRGLGANAMVLATGQAGGELTSQNGAFPSAIRHLRLGDRTFAGELRRAMSAMPSNGVRRQLVVWDGGGQQLSLGALRENLGILGTSRRPARAGGRHIRRCRERKKQRIRGSRRLGAGRHRWRQRQ